MATLQAPSYTAKYEPIINQLEFIAGVIAGRPTKLSTINANCGSELEYVGQIKHTATLLRARCGPGNKTHMYYLDMVINGMICILTPDIDVDMMAGQVLYMAASYHRNTLG